MIDGATETSLSPVEKPLLLGPARPAVGQDLQTDVMPELDHVRWVGGGSGAGKTTLARRLAERFNVGVYSTDAVIGAHSTRLDATAVPLLERFRTMSMDQRWVDRDPREMYRTFPWFHGEGFDLMLDDLRQFPADRPVIAEGFRLLPALVLPFLSDVRHGAWLLPTPRFRAEAFSRRTGEDGFWTRTTDPARALANLLERDRLFTDELTRQAHYAGIGVIHVDGTQTVDRLVDDLAHRFGLQAV